MFRPSESFDLKFWSDNLREKTFKHNYVTYEVSLYWNLQGSSLKASFSTDTQFYSRFSVYVNKLNLFCYTFNQITPWQISLFVPNLGLLCITLAIFKSVEKFPNKHYVLLFLYTAGSVGVVVSNKYPPFWLLNYNMALCINTSAIYIVCIPRVCITHSAYQTDKFNWVYYITLIYFGINIYLPNW